MPHDHKSFIGAWTLVDWRIEYEDGGVTRPFGKGAHGYIIYAANGIMTASICKAARTAFGETNARHASDAQKAGAFDSYFHYAGRWRIDGANVVHRVTMSLNPDMAGTDQVRLAVFDGKGGLTLSAEEATEGGELRRHILQWQSAITDSYGG